MQTSTHHSLLLLSLIKHSTGIAGWIPTQRLTSVEKNLQTTTACSEKVSPCAQHRTYQNGPRAKELDLTQEEVEWKIKTTLDSSLDFPAETPVRKSIGKLGLMWPSGYALNHDAAPLLSAYSEQGCPVDCGPDWSRDQIEILLKRGPHTSAKSKKAMKQLIEETKEKVRNNYARIVKWKDLKKHFPAKAQTFPSSNDPA